MTPLRNIVTRISLRHLTCPTLAKHNIAAFSHIEHSLPCTRYAQIHVSTCTRSQSKSESSLDPTEHTQTTGSMNDEDGEEEEEEGIYDREFVDMKVEDFAELYEDSLENKDKVQLVLSEYEYLKYNTIGRVPSVLETVDMQRLIEDGTSPYARNSIFNFLFKKEMVKRAGQRRKEQLREESRVKRELKAQEFAKHGRLSRSGLLAENGKITYGLWHNSLFCRIPENKIKTGLSASRLRCAAQFGPKLIFDFDFEDYMVNWTYRNAIDQVQEAYGMNRYEYEEPFDIWFCNFRKTSFAYEYCARKAIQNLESTSMITIKDDCFTNYFDRSRLVYLSPNAREPLGKINKSDDIYIIGVYNDKGNAQPVSLRKATKLGIKTKCLPLDTHVAWQGPSKSLCVNHVTGILLEVMANGGDWQAALMKHVPKRKIKPIELVIEEENKRMSNMRSRRKTAQFSLREDLD